MLLLSTNNRKKAGLGWVGWEQAKEGCWSRLSGLISLLSPHPLHPHPAAPQAIRSGPGTGESVSGWRAGRRAVAARAAPPHHQLIVAGPRVCMFGCAARPPRLLLLLRLLRLQLIHFKQGER